MRAWRIYLVLQNQEHLQLSQILIRLLVSLVSFSCLGLGFLWIIFNKNHYAWHDIISKTQVVYMPKVKS